MSLREKHNEIKRLIDAFEIEAQKFHDLQFSVHYVTQEKPNLNKKFVSPNHCIMLWQYYGEIDPSNDVDGFMKNLEKSNLQWGLRGAALTAMGVIEGPEVSLFVRMAKRAGNLFNKKETELIKYRVLNELSEKLKKNENFKSVSVSNNDELAIWLNYIIYHMSLDNPQRNHFFTIGLDPFSLSLLSLEHLLEQHEIGKIDKSTTNIRDIKFKVALSFPGEKRAYVSQVAHLLRSQLGADTVFYDYDYQAQLARPNLDTLLQDIYLNNSELIVVFLCSEYSEKEWCGLELRVIRDIIKSKQDERIMFVRFDDSHIEGVFSIDGYIDAIKFIPEKVSDFIIERINMSAPSKANISKPDNPARVTVNQRHGTEPCV